MHGGCGVGQARRVTVDARGEALARTAARAFGDVAAVGWVDAASDVLVVTAACHREPARDADVQLLLGARYRRGLTLPGRIWEAERGLLLVDVDAPALAAIAPEQSKRFIAQVGLRSLMVVPLWEGERVVGILGAGREPGQPPYTEEEFERLEAMGVLDGGPSERLG